MAADDTYGLCCSEAAEYKLIVAFNKQGVVGEIELFLINFMTAETTRKVQRGLILPPFIRPIGTSVKGLPYWAVNSASLIYRFNLVREEFEVKFAPPGLQIQGIGISGGKVILVTRVPLQPESVVLWCLGDLDSWTRLFSVPLSSVGGLGRMLWPLGLVRSLFFGETSLGLLAYNTSLREEVAHGWASPWARWMCFSSQQTLVSPSQGSN